MEDSIFTKIINGDIPAHKIYEDDKTIAFLDISPVRLGHTLVVPKTQVDQYIDLPNEDYDALWHTVKTVAARLREVLNTDKVGLKIVGVDVAHTHVHLIPFMMSGGEQLLPDDQSPEVTDSELAVLAASLKQ